MAYTLVKKIAQGGMAEIFLARKFDAQGQVKLWCVKRILSIYAEDEEFARMFRDEYRITKRFIHPALIAIKDLVHIGGMPSIVMEYIPGTDIRDILVACEKSGKRLSVPMVCYLIKEAAKGLHHAHTLKDKEDKPLNIVHRDVSPQNILVSFDGRIKIIDFGIADNEAKINNTRPGVIKGKFSYMSPEQVTMKPVDARTDVFALGVVMWEMLAMRKLFLGRNEVETIELVKHVKLKKDLRRLNKRVDEEMYRIVSKALSRSLSERYESSDALAQDLDAYLKKHHPHFTTKELSRFVTTLLRRKYRKTQELIKMACTTSSPLDDSSVLKRSTRLASLAEISEMREQERRRGNKQTSLWDKDFDMNATFEEVQLEEEEEEEEHYGITIDPEHAQFATVSNPPLSSAPPAAVHGIRVAADQAPATRNMLAKGGFHRAYSAGGFARSKGGGRMIRPIFFGVVVIVLVGLAMMMVDGSARQGTQSGSSLSFTTHPRQVIIKLNGSEVRDHYVSTPYHFDFSELRTGTNVFEFMREGFETRKYSFVKKEKLLRRSTSIPINLKATGPLSKIKITLDHDATVGALSFRVADNLAKGTLHSKGSEVLSSLMPHRGYTFYFGTGAQGFSCTLKTMPTGVMMEYMINPAEKICYRS